MKKLVFFCMMCMLMAASTFTAHAQEESKDYFVGKWLVKIQDLPVDIEEMMVDVARVDGKLKVNLSADGQQIEVQQVNEKETSNSLITPAGQDGDEAVLHLLVWEIKPVGISPGIECPSSCRNLPIR